MRLLMMLSCLILLTACSKGPGTETLRSDVQQRLQQVFPSSVLSLTELKRRGSANDANAPPGEERRVIYFDATLTVEQDQNFGAWDSPGVASLISVLGAGPRGLSGISNSGNHPGDKLYVHGSLIYRAQNGNWLAEVPQGFTAPRAAQASEGGSTTRENLVNAFSTALNLAPGDTGPQQRKAISDELERSLNNIQGRLSRLQKGYSLAGGPPAGQYARFAAAFSQQLKSDGLTLQVLNTEGGLDNLRMLRQGDVLLALSQSDAAYAAVHGTGVFETAGPDLKLRAIASLYPEPVHVLVSATSALQKMGDLRGQRVNIGQPGSASRLTALAVLDAHGLLLSDLQAATELDLQQALKALRDGQLDAVIQVIGAPADNIRAASEAFELRLIPLEAAALKHLQDHLPGSFSFSLPAESYPQQTLAVPTVAVASMLLTEEQLTAVEIERLVQLLFADNNQWLQNGSIQGAQLSRQNALRDLDVPLHSAAEKALRQLQAPPSPTPER
jgi:TRAP transporter TAXI family solute receptor